MVLSERLAAIVYMTGKSRCVVDVGCDHGYVPIELIKRGKCEKAYALDIKRGPLRICEKNIKKEGVEDSIETVLSDGLDAFDVSCLFAHTDENSLIIAGMGGLMISGILERAGEKAEAFGKLVLQPQSKIPELREYLECHDFAICSERHIEDSGKYYVVLRVSKGAMHLTPAERYFGINVDAASHDIYMKWLLKKKSELQSVAENLSTAAERAGQVSALLRLLDEVIAGNES